MGRVAQGGRGGWARWALSQGGLCRVGRQTLRLAKGGGGRCGAVWRQGSGRPGFGRRPARQRGGGPWVGGVWIRGSCPPPLSAPHPCGRCFCVLCDVFFFFLCLVCAGRASAPLFFLRFGWGGGTAGGAAAAARTRTSAPRRGGAAQSDVGAPQAARPSAPSPPPSSSCSASRSATHCRMTGVSTTRPSTTTAPTPPPPGACAAARHAATADRANATWSGVGAHAAAMAGRTAGWMANWPV